MHHAPQHPAQVTCFLSRFRRNRFDQDRFFFLNFLFVVFWGRTLPVCSWITSPASVLQNNSGCARRDRMGCWGPNLGLPCASRCVLSLLQPGQN